MLMVKTSVRPSPIEGLGLFAEERIPKGTVVWKYDPRFDISFDAKEIDVMPPIQKDLIIRYAYLDKDTGKYIYCIDNDRFINHSSINDNIIEAQPSTDPESPCTAKRDIEIGEEILINYRTFDANDAESDEAYLAS